MIATLPFKRPMTLASPLFHSQGDYAFIAFHPTYCLICVVSAVMGNGNRIHPGAKPGRLLAGKRLQ
jgi:hypothetical protein